ncbi:unnamed protein product [Bursaphelenchus xylophilus]|nr:unnamed protein product [Bursaphelenchus xylophilus]CAG9118020.1 unnamed protein product [Bursaphelenchus xylophilus]
MGNGTSAPEAQPSDTKVLTEAKPGFNEFPEAWISELKESPTKLEGKPKKTVRIQALPTIHELSSTQSSTVDGTQNSMKSVHPRVKSTASRESTGFCYDACYDPCWDYGCGGYGYGYDCCGPVYSPCYVPPVVVAGAPPPVYVQQQQQPPVIVQQQQAPPRVIQQAPPPTKFMVKDKDAPGGMREVSEEEIKQGKYKIKTSEQSQTYSPVQAAQQPMQVQYQQAPPVYSQAPPTYSQAPPREKKKSSCCGCC